MVSDWAGRRRNWKGVLILASREDRIPQNCLGAAYEKGLPCPIQHNSSAEARYDAPATRFYRELLSSLFLLLIKMR